MLLINDKDTFAIRKGPVMSKGIFRMALFCFIALFAVPALADVGVCEDDEGAILVSIMTHDNGDLLDLALTVGDEIMRFPEAAGSTVVLPAHKYKFAVKKTSAHDALVLEISGKEGSIKFRGKTIKIECNWQ